MSETSSVRNDATVSRRCQSASTTPRGQIRTPSHQGIHSGAHGLDGGDPEAGSMGVMGVPRPRSRSRGLGSKVGSQYSSNASLYSDMSRVSSAPRTSESMSQLRQKLMKNQQSWDQLLAKDPIKKLKCKGSRVNPGAMSDMGPLCSTPRGHSEASNPMSPHERLRDLERTLDRMASENNRLSSPIHVQVPPLNLAAKPGLAAKPPVPLNGVHAKPPVPLNGVHGSSKKVLSAHRFASPDSRDSAIDLDSASLQSNSCTSNTQTGSHKVSHPANSLEQSPEQTASPVSDESATVQDTTIPPPDSFAADRPSRARSRTPKLRSRGNSPLLNRGHSANSSVCGDSEVGSRPFTPEPLNSPSALPNGVNGVQGWNNSFSKDSDADSGISQPTPHHITVDNASATRSQHTGSSDSKQTSSRSSHHHSHIGGHHHGNQKAGARRPPPYQLRLSSPRSDGVSSSYEHSGINSQGQRPISSDRRRERVTFEDEVSVVDDGPIHRTRSQPAPTNSRSGGQVLGAVAEYETPPGNLRMDAHPAVPSRRGVPLPKSGDSSTRQSSPNPHLIAPPRHKHNKPVTSAHPTVDTQISPALVAPPRTKHKERRADQEREVAESGFTESNKHFIRSQSLLSLDSNVSDNSHMDDVDFDSKRGKKKSRLPWKRNKGKFTPSRESEKVQHRMLGEMSRSSSRTSLASSIFGELEPAPQSMASAPAVSVSEDIGHQEPYGQQKPTANKGSNKPPPAPKPKHLQQVNKPLVDQDLQENREKVKGQQVNKPLVDQDLQENRENVEGQQVNKPLINQDLHENRENVKGQQMLRRKLPEKPQDEISGHRATSDLSEQPERPSGIYQNIDILAQSDDPEQPQDHSMEPSHSQSSAARNKQYDDVCSTHEASKLPAADSVDGQHAGLIEPDYATASELNLSPPPAPGAKRLSSPGRSHYEDITDLAKGPRHSSDNPYESFEDGATGSDTESDGDDYDDDEFDDPENPVNMYSQVDYTKKTHHDSEEEVHYINYDSDFHDPDTPPLPDRGYDSNMHESKDLSGSKSSLFNRMDSLKRSAKKKFSKFRRSMSLEKVDKDGKDYREGNASGSVPPSPTSPEHPSPFKRSPSLKSLTETFGFVKKMRERKNSHSGAKNTDNLTADQRKPPRAPAGFHKKKPSISGPVSVNTPTHFRPIGNVRAINKDGTQVVEIKKPPHGPFGFYIARGNSSCNNGVLVSRLSDGLPDHFFAGLLSIGDEILAINGESVAQMALEEVYDLMASEDTLVLTVLPYTTRSEA